MNTLAKLLQEFHSKQSNIDNLRFSEWFCNNYIDGDWSDLYYEQDITVAVRKIDQWLRDNGKLQKMPKKLEEKTNETK